MSEQTLANIEERIAARVNPTITNEIRLRPTGAIAYNNADEMMEVAKLMAISQVAVPKHCRGNPGVCLAIVIRASEWEMSPFAVAEKTYVVNDRISFEAQLVNAVILRRAPITGRFKISYSGEGNNRKCKVAAKLTDGDLVDYESPTFATIPTKNSPLWKGDPDQQLFYYSSRAMCRRHFPDVLLGVYTPDEAADLPDEVPQKAAIGRIVPSELPQRPADAAPKEEPKGQEEEAPKTEEKPAPKAEPKPAPKPAEQPPEGPLAVLIAKAGELGVTERQLLKTLISMRLIEPSDTLAKLPKEKVTAILAEWDGEGGIADRLANPGEA